MSVGPPCNPGFSIASCTNVARFSGSSGLFRLAGLGVGLVAADDPVDLRRENAVATLSDVLVDHRCVGRRVAEPGLDLLDRAAGERGQRAG